jgi:hypothetical protein
MLSVVVLNVVAPTCTSYIENYRKMIVRSSVNTAPMICRLSIKNFFADFQKKKTFLKILFTLHKLPRVDIINFFTLPLTLKKNKLGRFFQLLESSA